MEKYHWQVIGTDYNSPFLRNNLWTHSFFVQAELYNLPRAACGIICDNNTIEYITDITTWIQFHEGLRKRVELNAQTFYEMLAKTKDHCEAMNEWTEKNIFTCDLRSLSNNQLAELLHEFILKQEKAYALGTAVALLDFDKFSFVEGNLKEFLNKKIQGAEYAEYLSTFTAPSHFSFAQEQELALLQLMNKYFFMPNWKEAVLKKTIPELTIEYPDFVTDLHTHTENFCWVYYVYRGSAFTIEQFLDFIKDYLYKGTHPDQKIKQIIDDAESLKNKKASYIEQLKPNEFEHAILELAGLIVWSKPRRKDYQSKSYYHGEKLLREIARRLALTLDQVRSAPYKLLADSLSGKEVDTDLINQIKSFHACIPDENGDVKTLSGEEAHKFSGTVERKITTENYQNIKELKGATACHGSAIGVVKIVNTPVDMAKMNYGDILISTATTPSIVAAMKKAAAIITDEGGLTCHASIVSRELKIPCVVGTKIATRVFHDGDRVNVNATLGTIQKYE